MTTLNAAGVQALPLAPKNPLPYRQQMQAARRYHTGLETLRDAGGPVTRLVLMPRWVAPPLVMVTSPQGAHDVLTSDDVDRTAVDPVRLDIADEFERQ